MIKVVVMLKSEDGSPRKKLLTFFHPHPELLYNSPYLTINDDKPYSIWGTYNKIETFDEVPQAVYVIIVHHLDEGE